MQFSPGDKVIVTGKAGTTIGIQLNIIKEMISKKIVRVVSRISEDRIYTMPDSYGEWWFHAGDIQKIGKSVSWSWKVK